MNNIIKRILFFVLIFCMTASSFTFAATAHETPVSQYDRQVEILIALGVLTESDILEDDAWLSRAQVAHFTASLTGVSGWGTELNGLYTDVNEKTSYAEDIYVLSQLGVLHGYGDGSFKPYNDITASETVKILMSAMGYTVPSEADGGYMAGYMKYAFSTKLLDDIECEMDEPLMFSDFIKMLYNALDVEVMSERDFVGDEVTLSTIKGNTVLTKLLRTQRAEGIIEANSFCSITSPEPCAPGRVIIDGFLFDEGNSQAGNLVGHNVEYYYKENSAGDYVILYAYALDSEKTITITEAEFELYTGNSFEYYQNDKTQSARVTKLTNILYNNRAADIDTDFKLSNGSITFIDNNSDRIYDVVFIEEYRNIYTQHVDYENGVIYDKYDGENPVNVELSDVGTNVLIYDRKNSPIEFENLKPDSLLSCLISKDGKSIIIYDVVDEVMGVVDEIEESGDSKYITIGGVSYSIAPELAKQDFSWNLGEKIICYLDKTGKLAVADGNKSTKFRWAIFEEASAKGGMSPEVKVRIFTEDSEEGQLSTYEIANKVTFDGVAATETDLAALSREAIAAKFGGNRVLIMYTLNADKEINAVLTEASDKINLYSNYTSYLVSASTRILGSAVGYSANTLLFAIPGGSAGEEYFSVGKATNKLSGNRSYSLKVYKMDPDSIDADVLILENKDVSTLFSRYSPSMIVDKIAKVITEDGETVERVYGYQGSSYVSYDGEKENTFSTVKAFSNPDSTDLFTLKTGDLIKFETNPKGQIRAAQLICRGSESKIFATANPSAVYSNASRVILGPVYQREGEGFQVTAKDPAIAGASDLELFRIISSTPVYVYDSSEDEVRLGTASDMLDYKTSAANCTKVAVYSDAGKINALLIIK